MKLAAKVRRQQPSRNGHAGASSAKRFHQERIENLKRDRSLLPAAAGITAVAVLLMVSFGGLGLAIGGFMLGFLTAVGMVGWMIAFDVHALTWLWGSWGEQQTAEELAKVEEAGWYVHHDVAKDYGNWDHIVVGPPGVFMIDTKRLHHAVSVSGDGLSSGRTRLAGRTFRGSAIGLREALRARVPDCPWVQAVVAVWGDFPDREVEYENVAYVAGDRLVDWLRERPVTLSDERRAALVSAIEGIAVAEAGVSTKTAADVLLRPVP